MSNNSIAQDFRFPSLLRFAFPTIIMMVFMSLYTIVDGIFISRFVGSNALSSVNIVYPFLSLVIACGVMLSTGGSALTAKRLGEGADREAKEIFSMLLLATFLLGVLLLLGGKLFLRPLILLLGSTDLLYQDCASYLEISLYFAPACVLQLFFQTFFVTAGQPGLGLALTAAGGIANMILDYIFMGPLGLGVLGAALATGLGQSVPAITGLLYFTLVRKNLLYIVKPRFYPGALLKSVFNGSSEMVTNVSNAVVTYLFNLVMLRFLGEPGVAAITIVLYSQFLFNALYMGFSMGVSPVISYNYGRKNISLLRRVTKICFAFTIVSSALITATALAATPAIVGIFTPPQTETYAIAKTGFFIFSFNYMFAGLNIFSSALFTALNNGIISAVISFLRTFVFIAVSILLLPQLLGVTGVWLSVPAAEFATLFLSLYLVQKYRGRYFRTPA